MPFTTPGVASPGALPLPRGHPCLLLGCPERTVSPHPQYVFMITFCGVACPPEWPGAGCCTGVMSGRYSPINMPGGIICQALEAVPPTGPGYALSSRFT